MGWVDALHGKLIGLDTAPLIYYIETNPAYIQTIDPFFDALSQGSLQVVTSLMTLLEVLAVPLRTGDIQLADRYRDILLYTHGVASIPMTEYIAEEAARLRAQHSLRTPDSIHTYGDSSNGRRASLSHKRRASAIVADNASPDSR